VDILILPYFRAAFPKLSTKKPFQDNFHAPQKNRTEKKTATRGKSAQSERAERLFRTIRRERTNQSAAQSNPTNRDIERAPQREKAVK